MYTRIRRTVCALFLICILLLQACPVSALGSTQVYTMTMQYATLNECEFQAQTVDFSTSHLFRDQLSDVNQTSLYDLIVVSTPASGSIVMTASDLPDFPATTSSSFESALVSFITDTVLPAYAAAVMDTPMLFWTSSVGYSCSYSVRGTKVVGVDIICAPIVADGFSEYNYNYARNRINSVLNSLTFDGDTRTELLKQFHDYLCNRIEYIETTYAHNIYGALVEGKSVCEGYAESFKLFCDLYEIPCMIISGMASTSSGYGAHAWNAVRLEDGKWYGVDVTWDDQNTILYDFFLVESESVPEHFPKITFAESHMPNGDFFGNGAVVMKFPALAVKACAHRYNGGVLTTAPTCQMMGTRTFTCTLCGEQYTEPVATVDHDYSDGACTVCGVAVPFMYGDCTGDGNVNGKDITRLLRYLASIDPITGESPIEINLGADCTGDGNINGKDVTRLLRYLASIDPITGESSITLGK